MRKHEEKYKLSQIVGKKLETFFSRFTEQEKIRHYSNLFPSLRDAVREHGRGFLLPPSL